MSFYQLEWDVPRDYGSWQENVAFFGGLIAGIVVLIVRAVLTARATKRTDTPPRTLRRRLGALAAVLIVGTFVGGILFNTDGLRRQQQQAALLAEHWHITVLDVRRLPGLDPAQNVPLDVNTPTGRRTCILSSYARHGAGGWRSTRPGRGGGDPQMRFELTCP